MSKAMDPTPLDHLRERWTIEGEIARGGMATVYLAHNGVGARVAIKVMQPRVVEAIGPQRFLREIAVARSMEHPLIVPLLESGEAAGALYYVMPYVRGEALARRLERDRRLPIAEAVRYTRDIASALGYAHARGILHRDVKPENLLLGGGRALVADFGLARAIGAADYERLTWTGVIVGTAHYLSPEQLLEERDLDGRTDIYCLATVLFEMLTGAPPFTGANLTELANRILRSAPPPLRDLRPDVPEVVDLALSRALAKSVTGRFATMEEFAAALGAE
jgi:eukaryotic-like serine/threonine-protein kinase